MKKIGKYKGFTIFEITQRDLSNAGDKSGYVLGDIISFLPDDTAPLLGYEEWVTGSEDEMHDFIDSYNKPKSVKSPPGAKAEDLPNNKSPKEYNAGYEIVQSVKVDERVSFAIGKDEKAPNPYVDGSQ